MGFNSLFVLLIDPEDGGKIFPRNIGHLSDLTASYTRTFKTQSVFDFILHNVSVG
jgi:hypothetical protein